jgi:hypothetical protein
VVIFLTWTTEERDLALRQQLRDSPRQAPDLTAVAPYQPSVKGDSPTAMHTPIPAAASTSVVSDARGDGPLIPVSPSSDMNGYVACIASVAHFILLILLAV